MGDAVSYLYVIGPTVPDPQKPWVKVGRSSNPDNRRGSLQTGQGEKLKVHGKFRVKATDAPGLEATLKAALAPLKIKGEVFRVPVELACGFAEYITAHGAPDSFLLAAIRSQVALQKWSRLVDLPGASGRRSDPEVKERVRVAEAEWQVLEAAFFAMDEARAAKIDPIGAVLHTYGRRTA